MEFYDFSASCTGGISYTLLDMPLCLSQSCSTSSINSELNEAIADINSIFQELGLQCTTTVSAATLTTFSIVLVLAVLVGYIAPF
jgi:hypothetical protein